MLDLQPASFTEFQQETRRGNVVPVVRSVLADLHTPVGAFLRVAGTAERAFLFESIEGGEKIARYSFLGADPYMTVRAKNSELTVETGRDRKVLTGRSMIEFLRRHFEQNRLVSREGLPPLCGGAVGFFAYDAAKWFEKILLAAKSGKKEIDGPADDALWMFFRNLLCFDHLRQRIEIVAIVLTDEADGETGGLRRLYQEALAETARIESLLLGGIDYAAPAAVYPADDKDNTAAPAAGQASDATAGFRTDCEKKDFLAAVARIKQKILAGDCYQVVLSQNFSRRTRARPLNIYRALRTTNPSPYMFYIKCAEDSLIGASPEMLVRCTGRRLEYRPIAGTRKRGRTEREDLVLADELRADEKERAEHVMLVDLGRNDLGRVAEYGSVEVAELMKVERYSHVQHLVSSLTATLRPGLDRFDALVSCFPAGTVSGAPKVRAMQIIDELEPTARGVYSGAIGYIDYAGNLDTCIAIRTIGMRTDRAAVRAGAGIVADSVPENEYQETINKARALIRAVEIAENFDSPDGSD